MSQTESKADIAKKNELIILKEIKRICDKYNIRYYLSSGTLLGAIRHDGFIPWDDDIDIEMPLKDYKFFIKVCKKELGERFFLQTFETDPNYYYPFAKVRMNNTAFIVWNSEKHHIHQGFWVDIFPVTKVSKNRYVYKFQKFFLKISKVFQMSDYCLGMHDILCEEIGEKNVKLAITLGRLPVSWRIALHKLFYDLALSNPEKGDDIAQIFMSFFPIPKDTCFELIEHKFEDEYYKIPKNYDIYLTDRYGDYMQLPPEEKRVTHSSVIVDENNDYSKYVK
ncbi:MAG: LicD family protein [Acutalibacteraceae bacterium]|nr:LicD family protein [Acutalibacteraceae bacterium]